MLSNNYRKKLFISLLIFPIIIGSIYLFYYFNKQLKRPNIILITIDALRADHLSCYGYKRNTSPNIDKLAKEGVLFTQAIAQASHTPPSIGSILTAAPPHKHLLLHWGGRLNSKIPTIAEILKSRGYETIFIGGNGNFEKGLGGFIKYFDKLYMDFDAGEITSKVIGLINDFKNKPFFILLHYMNVHAPYEPAKPYDKLFVNDAFYNREKNLPIVKPSLDWYGFKGISEVLAKEKGGITNPDYYIAQYDGAIRTVDEEIGKIIKKLREFKLHKKTIIIITADHGEMLGEHDYYFHHGWFLYEPLIKIPLIIKCDKVILRNKVISNQVSAHLDIGPTILGILKIKRPKTMQGVNLLEIIFKRKEYPCPYTFVSAGLTINCVRTNEWKLIYNQRNSQEYELYNLKDDLQETNNLASIKKGEFRLLKEQLDKYIKETAKEDKINKTTLDEETKDKLRLLGYVE